VCVISADDHAHTRIGINDKICLIRIPYEALPKFVGNRRTPLNAESNKMTHDLFQKECLVLGCGNPLLGDDGFGPAVIDHLHAHCQIPDHTACIDVGTAISGLLFDILLSDRKPRRMILVDAIDMQGKQPGEILEIDIDAFPQAKITDFTPHQFPTVNMLKEIRDFTAIDLHVLAVQIEHIPDEVQPGLSPSVTAAIPLMCQRILEIAGRSSS
jgi:coenzyme F420 hydrogenase subunit delta